MSQTVVPVRRIFGPEFASVPKAGSQVGLALKEEAIDNLHARRWKNAIGVSLAAQQLRPNDGDLHAIVAVSAAYSKKHTLCQHAVQTLRRIANDKKRPDTDRANALIAIASVRIAQERFHEADTEARKALAFDATDESSWWHLTASFAGLGWFDRASACLPLTGATPEEFTKANPATRQETESVSSDPVTTSSLSFAEWQIGRAINSWAMSKTMTWLVAIIGFISFGALGLAIASLTPLIVREIRVLRLDKHWRRLAENSWRTEHKVRIGHALVTLTMLGLWTASLAFS